MLHFSEVEFFEEAEFPEVGHQEGLEIGVEFHGVIFPAIERTAVPEYMFGREDDFLFGC